MEISTQKLIEKIKNLSEEYNNKKLILDDLVTKCDSIEVISETDISYRNKIFYIEEIEKIILNMKAIQEKYQILYEEFCKRNKIDIY